MQDSMCLEKFENYLANEKKASNNTLSSYLRDIRQFGSYLSAHTEENFDSATEEDLANYVAWLRSAGKSVATVSRSIASLKSFYSYLLTQDLVETNPAVKLVPDKSEHKLPQILTKRQPWQEQPLTNIPKVIL